jgi:hypothetical protein
MSSSSNDTFNLQPIANELNNLSNDLNNEFSIDSLFTNTEAKFKTNPIIHLLQSTTLNLELKNRLQHEMEIIVRNTIQNLRPLIFQSKLKYR